MEQKCQAFRQLIFVHGLSCMEIIEEFKNLFAKDRRTYIIGQCCDALGRIYVFALNFDPELADKLYCIVEDSNVRSRIMHALAGTDGGGS